MMIRTLMNSTIAQRARGAILSFATLCACSMGAAADGSSIDQNFCASLPVDPIKKAIVETALTFDVEAELVLALAETESQFRTDKIGEFGAVGVMQVKPFDIDAFYSGDVRSLAVTNINVSVAVRYLKQLYRDYDQRWDLALAHYHSGPLVREQDGFVLNDETDSYIQRVFASRGDYRRDANTQCLIKFHYPDFVLAGGSFVRDRQTLTVKPGGRRAAPKDLAEVNRQLNGERLFLAASTTFPYGYDAQQIALKQRFSRSLENKRVFRQSLRDGRVFRGKH